jgi:hypothetical protein
MKKTLIGAALAAMLGAPSAQAECDSYQKGARFTEKYQAAQLYFADSEDARETRTRRLDHMIKQVEDMQRDIEQGRATDDDLCKLYDKVLVEIETLPR